MKLSLVGWPARLAALPIAACAWVGIVINVVILLPRGLSLGGAIWHVAGYFTITTNLLVALAFSGVALGRVPGPRLMGGICLSIVLVGVIYALLLKGLVVLHGPALLADGLIHQVVPVAVPLFWLCFVPKGFLRWRDPWLWAVYPLVYLFYAIARGRHEGRYVYPFIDLGKLGVQRVAVNAVAIAAGFLLVAALLVWLDRWLGSGRREGDRRVA